MDKLIELILRIDDMYGDTFGDVKTRLVESFYLSNN